MTVENEIAAFFVGYVEAFALGDAEAVSELWDEVALFPSPGGNFAMDRQAFRDHCTRLMNFYRQQGVVRPEGELLSATELFPNVAQARMAYRMKGEGDTLIAKWEHVYVLRRSDRWRVSLTIADGEIAVWPTKGAQL
ncbi:MAG: nuclear transport factor 2 family protein [Alphaproteobacteria bacterium]|nr:MAG: nuclear transport factor 2 family protein [Alphaproteobacteria bacterium]